MSLKLRNEDELYRICLAMEQLFRIVAVPIAPMECYKSFYMFVEFRNMLENENSRHFSTDGCYDNIWHSSRKYSVEYGLKLMAFLKSECFMK